MKKLFLILCVFGLIAMPMTGFSFDPLVEKQWYLEKINAFDAWDITKGNEDVIVALLDIGVDITHPDLSNNIWVNFDEYAGDGIDNDKNGFVDDINGWDFIYDQPDPAPALESYNEKIIHHGTFVAGVISAMENGKGITGVANKVKLMPLKVLDEFGMGDSFKVAEAIDYAIDNGADVINLSLAGYDDTADLTRAIERARENNVIIVASAGNGFWGYGFDLAEQSVYPICYDKENEPEILVIGAASTNEDDLPSGFSNFGMECVDISAPGENMFSTKIHQLAETEDEYYGNGSEGTSFSSAIVSSAVALMRSVNKSLNINEIMQALTAGAEKIDLPGYMNENDMGAGRVNIYKSLNNILLKYGISASASPWKIMIAQKTDGRPAFKILNKQLESEMEIKVFPQNFAQGLTLQSLDINNDNNLEYIVAPEKNSPSLVRIYSLNQKLLESKYLYEPKYVGGVSFGKIKLADGKKRLLSCTGPGRLTEFSIINENLEKEKTFKPFNHSGGCVVSAGDVNDDGKEEIIVAGLADSEIKIYDQNGEFINSFSAYSDLFKGINLNVRDINGDGRAEIITGPRKGQPLVKIFDAQGKASISFMAYNRDFSGGVLPIATDYDKNGNLEILTAPGSGGGPHLRVFDILGNVLFEKFVYPVDFFGGVNIANAT